MESVLYKFGVGRSIANDLKVKYAKMWLLNHQSLVQPSIGGHHRWYVVYRVLAAIYLLSTFLYIVSLILSGERPNMMFMHYPMVGYLVSVIGAILHAYATWKDYSHGSQLTDVAIKSVRRLKGYRRRRFLKMGSKQDKIPKIYAFIWFAFNIQLFWALFTFIVYFNGIFKGILPHVQPSAKGFVPDEVFLHIAYFVYTFVDFWLSGIPVRLLHFYMVIVFDIIYKLIVLAVVYLFVYDKHIGQSMYDVLNLRADRVHVCVMIYIGFTIIMPIAIHNVYFYLFIFRSHFVSWLLASDHVDSQPQQQQQQQQTPAEDPLQLSFESELNSELLVPGMMDDSSAVTLWTAHPPLGKITEIDESELENISIGQHTSRTALQQSPLEEPIPTSTPPHTSASPNIIGKY